MAEREKLAAAGVSLDGDALSWLQWAEIREPFMSWDDFKRRLLMRFRSSQEGTLHEQFLAIRQVGTVAEYRRDFELLSAPLRDLTMEVLESTFVKELKPEVSTELRIMRPSGPGQIMELAQLIEDCNTVIRGIRESTGPRAGGALTA